MKNYVYSVLDTKLGVFGGLFVDGSDGAAIRGFGDGVNDKNPKNRWNAHPEDFTLYRVGEFNIDTGELIPQHPAKSLVTASGMIEAKITHDSAQLDFRDKNLSIEKPN